MISAEQRQRNLVIYLAARDVLKRLYANMTISYSSPSYVTDKNAYIKKKPCALYLGRKIKDTDELILRNIAYKQNIPVCKMVIKDTSVDYRLKPVRQKNTAIQLLLK